MDFLADWAAPGRDHHTRVESPEPCRVFFNACYHASLADITASTAEVLRRPQDAERYRARAAAIRSAAHEAFYDPDDQSYVGGEQPYLAMALLTGVTPQALAPKVAQRLEHEIITECEGHIHAGVLGTRFLLRYLTDVQRHDLIATMVRKKTYPGWGHMIENGAGALWERWDGRHSRIHTSFLSVGPWMTEGVAGIERDASVPGYKRFFIRPPMLDGVQWARGEYRSLRGVIRSRWERADDRLRLQIDVPPGAAATVVLPTGDPNSVLESGRPAEEAQGVSLMKRQQRAAFYRVESGRYRFESNGLGPSGARGRG
jgi:alpha-L-rhamnosidase